MQFWHPSVRRGAAGLKPQRPPIVGNINMQKFWVHIGAFSKKIMAKIVTLCHNKTYIAPALGPPIWGKYSKGQGYCVRGYLSFQSPRVPGTGVFTFPGFVIFYCTWPAPRKNRSEVTLCKNGTGEKILNSIAIFSWFSSFSVSLSIGQHYMQYISWNAFYRLLRKIRSAPEKFRST